MRVRCSRTLILLGALTLLPACTGGSDRAPAPTTTTTSVVPPSTTTTAPTANSLSVTGAPWRLPAPTSRAVLLTDGTKLILLGGQDARHQSTAAGYVIDPTSGARTSIGPLAPAVHDAAGVELGGRSLVIAGGTPPARATVQAVAPGSVTTIGQLAAPRTDHVATIVNQTIYVLGGADASEAPTASVVASSDGVTWHDAGSLAEAVRYPAIATVDGAVYLFGGVGSAHADTTSIQRYDPTTMTTTVVAHVPARLSHASAIVLGGRVWILGGFVDDVPSTQILRFDPATNDVVPAGSLPAPLTDAAAVALDGTTAYLVGGEGPNRATTAAAVQLSAQPGP